MGDLPKSHGNIGIIEKKWKDMGVSCDISSKKYTYENGNIIQILGVYRNIMGI